MDEHLGYPKHGVEGRNHGNSRNGSRSKTVITEIGPVDIDVPRDRDSSFDPQTVRKGQRRLDGVDAIVILLTAKGLTTGEVEAHLAEVYATSVDLTGDDLQCQTRPGQVGLEPLVTAAQALDLNLFGGTTRLRLGPSPSRAPASRALRHSARCELYRPSRRSSAPARSSHRERVVLVEDPGLVVGGERTPPWPGSRVGLVHHAIMGARDQRCSRHGHGLRVPVSPWRDAGLPQLSHVTLTEQTGG